MFGRILGLAISFTLALGQNLSDAQVTLVKQRLAEGANRRYVARALGIRSFDKYLPYSWELGTRAQSLLELDAPSFSVLTVDTNNVPPVLPINSTANSSLSDVFTIARDIVAALPGSDSSPEGRALTDGDGSAGDPTSLGVAVMLANWTGLPGEDYERAIEAEISYLLNGSVPKSDKGAISHRVSEVQLWYVLRVLVWQIILMVLIGAILYTWSLRH